MCHVLKKELLPAADAADHYFLYFGISDCGFSADFERRNSIETRAASRLQQRTSPGTTAPLIHSRKRQRSKSPKPYTPPIENDDIGKEAFHFCTAINKEVDRFQTA